MTNDGWNRVEMIMDTKETTANARLVFFASTPTTFWVSGVQVEEKPYSTPFVDGSRQASITDYSINNNIGVIEQETSPRWINDAKVGNGSYLFDSSNESFIYREITDPINYPITFSLWAKRDANNNMVPISLTETTSRYVCIHFSSRYRIEVRSSDWSNFDSSVNTSSNEWVHLAGVISSDTSRKIYIDGKLANEDTTEAVLPNFNSLYIGKQRNIPIGTGHGPLLFDGQIDDVRIYNRLLNDDEINMLYNQSK